jgi:hypothetical protein
VNPWLVWSLFAFYAFLNLVLVAIGQSPDERAGDDLREAYDSGIEHVYPTA